MIGPVHLTGNELTAASSVVAALAIVGGYLSVRSANRNALKIAREEREAANHARWLTDRRAVYAEYLLSLEAWKSAIVEAEIESRTNGAALAEGTRAALSDLEQKSQSVYEIISILAPIPIVSLAGASFTTLMLWGHYLESTPSGKNVNSYEDAEDDYYDKSYSEGVLLREAIRQDLGVDPPQIGQS
jgi:hypothetical protein